MKKDPKGFALIIVLTLVTILAAVVVEFAYTTRVEVELTSATRDDLQAYALAYSGIEIAKSLLLSDLQEDQEQGAKIDFIPSELDPTEELWAQTQMGGFESFPITTDEAGEIGVVSIKITDESSKFYLNGLVKTNGVDVDTEAAEMASRLLEALELPPEIVDDVIDWIDTDDTPYGLDSVESPFYASLDKPYESRDSFMLSISELQMIHGVDDATARKLQGQEDENYRKDALGSVYLSAYPRVDSWAINVNTASAMVLQSISAEMSSSVAESLIERREEEPFKSVSDFTQELANSGIQLSGALTSRLAVRSDVFSVRAEGVVHGVSSVMEAVLKRGTTSSGGATSSSNPIEILFLRVL
ncbi:MAG: type II secretion system minor pseudopilin GspK [Deltaproteobacteria bacterium]|nr:type II secretion system minor pseudopilin GspK [Deltaproteobacteria bacterium]